MKWFFPLMYILPLTLSFFVYAGSLSEAVKVQFDHSHSLWTNLLQKYVLNGNVDYEKWKETGTDSLNSYLQTFSSVSKKDYQKWNKNQKIAFWINAYNAFTVRLILDHYPIQSIRKIGFLPFSAFRKKFISMPELKKNKLSLDGIEKGILLKEFQEPRIHFALVCASKSCPVLQSNAYQEKGLEAQLERDAKAFIQDPRKNYYKEKSKTLYLSSIFKWYKPDFTKAKKTLKAYVVQYMEPQLRQRIRLEKVKIKFLKYDWSLNGR